MKLLIFFRMMTLNDTVNEIFQKKNLQIVTKQINFSNTLFKMYIYVHLFC